MPTQNQFFNDSTYTTMTDTSTNTDAMKRHAQLYIMAQMPIPVICIASGNNNGGYEHLDHILLERKRYAQVYINAKEGEHDESIHRSLRAITELNNQIKTILNLDI